ncbi:hypothetical protein ABIB40_000954 [Pedobacter sp. UYP30]|uniref:hypothetical protein n=1 Tax=Pedobacter sp. UYP30 TaxID=1756400 RepID=UPI00339B43C1
MKKIAFTFLSFIIALSTAHVQKGIDFNKNIAAGGILLMSVDSSAKNVVYAVVFPNQPNTWFNYLPEVNNLNIQINFRKDINIQHYRYTILVDDKPIAVNKSIDIAKLKDTHAGGDEELFSTTSLGTFVIKDKIITTLVYSVDKPQDIYKSIFYGKPLPKTKIKAFGKRFKTEKGVDYKYIIDPKENTKLIFTKNDDELTIVKDKSDIDYLYNITIKDKKTNEIIFESDVWQYGGLVTENHEFAPHVKIDRNIFKKSGDYEIIIQPSIKWTNCFDCEFSQKEIESYATRYTLAITIDKENYTKKDL